MPKINGKPPKSQTPKRLNGYAPEWKTEDDNAGYHPASVATVSDTPAP